MRDWHDIGAPENGVFLWVAGQNAVGHVMGLPRLGRHQRTRVDVVPARRAAGLVVTVPAAVQNHQPDFTSGIFSNVIPKTRAKTRAKTFLIPPRNSIMEIYENDFFLFQNIRYKQNFCIIAHKMWSKNDFNFFGLILLQRHCVAMTFANGLQWKDSKEWSQCNDGPCQLFWSNLQRFFVFQISLCTIRAVFMTG